MVRRGEQTDAVIGRVGLRNSDVEQGGREAPIPSELVEGQPAAQLGGG